MQNRDPDHYHKDRKGGPREDEREPDPVVHYLKKPRFKNFWAIRECSPCNRLQEKKNVSAPCIGYRGPRHDGHTELHAANYEHDRHCPREIKREGDAQDGCADAYSDLPLDENLLDLFRRKRRGGWGEEAHDRVAGDQADDEEHPGPGHPAH